MDRRSLTLAQESIARVALAAGRTATVTLPLAASDLAYWSEADGRFVVERDAVELRVGGSSADLPLRTTLAVRSRDR